MPPETSFLRIMQRALLLALLLAGLPAQAAWYQVEVIVFERLKPDTDGEAWVENPGLPDRSAGIDLLTELPPTEPLAAAAPDGAATGPGTAAPAAAPERLVPYMKLASSRHRLEGIYRAFKLSSEYRPLLHVAWQQPGEGPSAGSQVHLVYPAARAGEDADEALSMVQPIIDGMVGLRVTRFLHAEVDMAYFPPAQVLQANAPRGGDTALPGALAADYVRLHERRKILLNELHYFDHPLFGVILQVSRIEQ